MNEAVNGFEDQPEPPKGSEAAVLDAQNHLLEVLQSLPMNPQGMAQSGFINASMQSAALAGVKDFLCECGLLPKGANGSWTSADALNACIVRRLNMTANMLQQQRAQMLQTAPRIITPPN